MREPFFAKSTMLGPLGTALVLMLAFATAGSEGARAGDQGEDRLKKELHAAIGRLRSDSAREIARNMSTALIKDTVEHPADPPIFQQAVFFFHDVVAKDVLLAVLATRSNVHWGAKQTVCECLDIFTIRDLQSLYETAQLVRLGATQPFDFLGTEHPECDAVLGSLDALNYRASELLGIKYEAIVYEGARRGEKMIMDDRELRRHEIYCWWLKAITTAKAKKDHPPEIDDMLEYLETNKVERPKLKTPQSEGK